MKNIFTFWEGSKPAYIEMCMATWHFPFTLLNYENLNEYTDLSIDKLRRFSLPQIADAVRVHVLRDHGGHWLDADTIMIGDRLPDETIMGDPDIRTNTIGYLHTDPHSEMFERWAEFQDNIINDDTRNTKSWSLLGNDFTDDYVKRHKDVTIHPIENCWPETYMVGGGIPRIQKYRIFYFVEKHELSEIRKTDILMLHNSWTFDWYKSMTRDEVLAFDKCTLSNFLREILDVKL